MKLCYVKGSFAYFTDKPLSEQWGDDWDDAPYEHNAGLPYDHHGETIIKVAFDGPLNAPCEGHCNSPYSVENINAGETPWLKTDKWCAVQVFIPAGVSIEEFTALVHKAGGNVYLPAQPQSP